MIFIANKEDLYKYLHQDKQSDAIIQVILRSYTGLFADYAYINEALIATRANVSQQEVYDTLIGLSKYHIVKYIPHKKTPLIIYTQTREDLKSVVIQLSAFEERKQRFETRIQRVLDYIREDSRCRSRMWLESFGEAGSADCGWCDDCLARKST